MRTEYRVGTRGSALALEQTRRIVGWLEAARPGSRFRVVEIRTHGDRYADTPIHEMGRHLDAGIFNSALEAAVMAGEVDFATCSFKDVESALPEAMRAVTVGPREDPRDVLVSRHGRPLAELPRGAELATSSPRRTSQLGAYRADLRFAPLRGNINTRVERAAQRFDGILLAGAGMMRLGLQAHITEWIAPEVLLPAPAQGALGCEFLAERTDVAALVEAARQPETELCVRAEKALLVSLSGGCYAPIGALARMRQGQLVLHCRVTSLDGRDRVEDVAHGPPEEWEAIVDHLARRVAGQGGVEIVQAARRAFERMESGEP